MTKEIELRGKVASNRFSHKDQAETKVVNVIGAGPAENRQT